MGGIFVFSVRVLDVYWMFRDQRLRDNWALIHAVDQANRLNVPVAVAFNLFDQFLGAKAQYGARTIRRKINNLLPNYLTDFPPLKPQNINNTNWISAKERSIDWETDYCKCSNERSRTWNNPLKPEGLPGPYPYLHFGQISAQRCALEARKVRKINPHAIDVFLEELIVRRELSDNFCYYDPLQGVDDSDSIDSEKTKVPPTLELLTDIFDGMLE
ncbi:hypothetical protein LXL04_030220 [Taraxacum kok-saghyz]